MSKSERDDRYVLQFNPWGDDDSPYRVLDNRMVITRVSHECAICFESIPNGQRVRAQRESLEGKARTFYFCQPCCSAMAVALKRGDIEPLERRTQIGMQQQRADQGGKGTPQV